jgi:hypothetical protein
MRSGEATASLEPDDDRVFQTMNVAELMNSKTYNTYIERETLPEGPIDQMLMADGQHSCGASGLCFPNMGGGYMAIDAGCGGWRQKCPWCHRRRQHGKETCIIGDKAAHAAKRTGGDMERPKGYDPYQDFADRVDAVDMFESMISPEELELRDKAARRDGTGAGDDDDDRDDDDDASSAASSDDEMEGAAADDDSRCDICGYVALPDGADSTMLLCDGCNGGRHLLCCEPVLDTVPEGDWFCDKCGSTPSEKTAKVDDAQYHSVGTIIEERKMKSKRTGLVGPHVHIHWCGYPPNYDTWEPLENLTRDVRMVWARRRVSGKPLYVNDPHPSTIGTKTRPSVNLFDRELEALLDADPDALGVECSTEKERIKAADGTTVKPSDKKTYVLCS